MCNEKFVRALGPSTRYFGFRDTKSNSKPHTYFSDSSSPVQMEFNKVMESLPRGLVRVNRARPDHRDDAHTVLLRMTNPFFISSGVVPRVENGF